MARSHKQNDRNHKGVAEGTTIREDNKPRYFAKSGFPGDPNKTKKNGCGKGNWGGPGDEILDEQFTFSHTRRRSNSSVLSNHLLGLKTKFDINETEPVFEESIHGPGSDYGDVESNGDPADHQEDGELFLKQHPDDLQSTTSSMSA